MNDTTFDPSTILNQCTVFNPLDQSYLNHSVIERFGHPQQPLYVDQSKVDSTAFNMKTL